MGREKPLKTRVKEARQLASATEYGKQLGDHKGQARKPLEVSLKEHIGKFIDNIKADDIFVVGSWFAIATIIRPACIELAKTSKRLGPAPLVIALPIQLLTTLRTMLGLKSYRQIAEEESRIPPEPLKEQEELYYWILALAISALILKFGPSVLESLGGVGSLGALLL